MQDYSADGHHYKSALDTPLEIDGKVRSVDDFQPRKNVKEYLAQGMLKSENDFERFCRTFACGKILVKKYVQHLKILEINKRKRADIRKNQEQESKRYEEYEWTKLFEEGKLKKLKVQELDKYLIYHNLRKSLNLRRKEKVTLINSHIASSRLQTETPPQPDDSYSDSDEGVLSESGQSDSDDDIVLDDAAAASSSSDSSEEDEDETLEQMNHDDGADDESIETIFTRTKYGRLATNWRASNFVSIFLYFNKHVSDAFI